MSQILMTLKKNNYMNPDGQYNKLFATRFNLAIQLAKLRGLLSPEHIEYCHKQSDHYKEETQQEIANVKEILDKMIYKLEFGRCPHLGYNVRDFINLVICQRVFDVVDENVRLQKEYRYELTKLLKVNPRRRGEKATRLEINIASLVFQGCLQDKEEYRKALCSIFSYKRSVWILDAITNGDFIDK